jgi:hypothetical protein
MSEYSAVEQSFETVGAQDCNLIACFLS